MSRLRVSDVLDIGLVYAAWQAPFANLKMEPLIRHNSVSTWNSVLDVACGPGTNARYFDHTHYLGFDLNQNYVNLAIQRYGPKFVVGNSLNFVPPHPWSTFQHILANSFFHHLTDAQTLETLHRLKELLQPDGSIHILDLVMPDRSFLGRWLARNDRGHYARSLDCWQRLFQQVFEELVFEPFVLKRLGIGFWHMVYFKGRRKAESLEDGVPE